MNRLCSTNSPDPDARTPHFNTIDRPTAYDDGVADAGTTLLEDPTGDPMAMLDAALAMRNKADVQSLAFDYWDGQVRVFRQAANLSVHQDIARRLSKASRR